MDAMLPVIWAGILAFGIMVYVVLDGFDLGIGILFGTTRHEHYRRQMMGSVAPVWDGNETWLLVIGAGLFATFPVVYAIFLSAFYLPVILLLVALIFRGVAFEFRHKTEVHALGLGLGLLFGLCGRDLRPGCGDWCHGQRAAGRGRQVRSARRSSG